MCISKYPTLELFPTDTLEEYSREKIFVSYIEQATHFVPALKNAIYFLYVHMILLYPLINKF